MHAETSDGTSTGGESGSPSSEPERHLIPGSRSLTILVHGFEGARTDWRERGGYTKGGDLTDRLGAAGRSWLACDLYGHGDWVADEPDFSPEHISDELFPGFLTRSADAIRAAVIDTVAEADVDHLDVVTYSSGCHVVVQLLKGPSLPRPVSTLAMAVPTPEREYDDEFSLHNNLAVFDGPTVGVFAGRDDDVVALDEVRWFFEQLPGTAKRRWEYASGHALPSAWTDDAVALLTDPASVVASA